MVVRKNTVEMDDKKIAVMVELKNRIEENQKALVGAIGETYAFNTRQVSAILDDIEHYKRLVEALKEVKI